MKLCLMLVCLFIVTCGNNPSKGRDQERNNANVNSDVDNVSSGDGVVIDGEESMCCSDRDTSYGGDSNVGGDSESSAGDAEVCGGDGDEPEDDDDSEEECSDDCNHHEEEFFCSEDKVAICHRPPGNQENSQNICVSASAVDHHFSKHNDVVGSCP